MSANQEVIEAIMAQLENIESAIEEKTNKLRELKAIRRKLNSTIATLQKL